MHADVHGRTMDRAPIGRHARQSAAFGAVPLQHLRLQVSLDEPEVVVLIEIVKVPLICT